MVNAETLAFAVLFGATVGLFLGYFAGTANARKESIIELAKMRITADAGGNPLLVGAEKKSGAVRTVAPGEDGLKQIERKIKDRYGKEYEIVGGP